MNISNSFFQECMLSLTDISVYRSRINKIRNQCKSLKSKFETGQTNQKYLAVIQAMHIALNKLNSIERSILYIMNENAGVGSFHTAAGTKPSVSTEDELFENMRIAHNLYIEVQRSWNYYSKETSLPAKQLSKVINLEKSKKIGNDIEKEVAHNYS